MYVIFTLAVCVSIPLISVPRHAESVERIPVQMETGNWTIETPLAPRPVDRVGIGIGLVTNIRPQILRFSLVKPYFLRTS